MSKTSTGLEPNVAAVLSYVLGFITGIIFLLIEEKNRFVRFHAMQSIFFSGSLLIINIVLSVIPFLGWGISWLISVLAFVVWIVLMIKAYQNERYKLPIIGDLAENQLK